MLFYNKAIIYERHTKDISIPSSLTCVAPFLPVGMPSLEILRNYAVTPYVINAIEKVIYFNRFIYGMEQESVDDPNSIDNEKNTIKDNYNDVVNKWEENEYYFEDNFYFLNVMYESKDDYLIVRDDPYFAKAEFDDNWYKLVY